MELQECLDRMPKSIDDVSLGLYLSFNKEIKGLKEEDYKNINGQMKLFRVVELFVGVEEGEIDDISLEDMQVLCETVSTLITDGKKFEPSDHFTIDGINYSTRKIKDMNSLSTGEYTSVKLIQEQHLEESEFLPLILAILIRPATLVIDDESKEGRWVQERFNQKDIDNLTFRSELFKKKALAKDLIPVCNFFLTGNE